MNSLLDLAKSLTAQDTKTLSQKCLKLQSEVGELSDAILPYEGAQGSHHVFPNRDNIVEECADVMLVAYSIANSIGSTDDELIAMLRRKTLYWQAIQQAETEVDVNNLMFEVHITISATGDIDTFASDCREIGVKPIILDLYASQETILDVMTSSHFKGTTLQASIYSRGLVSALEEKGYTVLREKIETVPWHPASKRAHNNPSASRYFEAHLAFACDSFEDVLKPFMDRHRIKLSRNKMKKHETAVMMGTYRRSSLETDVTGFERALAQILLEADSLDLKLMEPPVTEFALFDTNNLHDQSWMDA